MSTDFTITIMPDYIHIRNAPDYEINLEGVLQQWHAIVSAARKHGCPRALVEGGLPRRQMSFADAFASGSMPLEAGVSGLRVALCLEGYVPDNLTHFFETVAANRGFAVAFFSNREEALAWLGVAERQVSTPAARRRPA